MWNQYLKEITEWKRPILGRLANHNALVEHMRAQAVAGESVIRKPMNEPLLTELDTLAAPQPIMAQSFA
jgi:hypothetical protein